MANSGDFSGAQPRSEQLHKMSSQLEAFTSLAKEKESCKSNPGDPLQAGAQIAGRSSNRLTDPIDGGEDSVESQRMKRRILKEVHTSH